MSDIWMVFTGGIILGMLMTFGIISTMTCQSSTDEDPPAAIKVLATTSVTSSATTYASLLQWERQPYPTLRDLVVGYCVVNRDFWSPVSLSRDGVLMIWMEDRTAASSLVPAGAVPVDDEVMICRLPDGGWGIILGSDARFVRGKALADELERTGWERALCGNIVIEGEQ